MATPQVVPPPPPGFTLDATPPPPEGFTLDTAPTEAKAEPTPAPKEEVGMKDIITGSPPARFALGVADFPLGIAELGLHAGDFVAGEEGVGADFTKALKNMEESKRRGMDWWAKKTGVTAPSTSPDWLGLTGSFGLGGLATKALPIAKTGPKRVLQAAGIGGGMGAATPVADPEKDFVQTKAMQTGLGTLIGGGLSAVPELASTVVRWGKDIVQSVPTVAKRLLNEYMRENIGAQNIPAVTKAAENVQALVKGSDPMVAEAMVGVPEGTWVQAFQERMAQQAKGGASVEFNKRLMEKEAARIAAGEAAEGLAGPLRDEALRAVNAGGGAKTQNLMAKLYDLAEDPMVQGTPLVNALTKVRERISALSDNRRRMDANTLYNIRDGFGKLAQTAYKQGDGLIYGKLREAQTLIDNAMEESGGVRWKEYLDTYSRQIKLIEQDAERQAKMYQPLQKSAEGGAENIAKGMREIPHVLEREVVIANGIINWLRSDLQPKINEISARLLLNPQEFAKALSETPKGVDPKVWEAMITTIGVASGQLGGQAGKAMQPTARNAAQALGASPKP